jgi:hypothetical protein
MIYYNITFFFKKAIEDRVIGKCMFNNGKENILDQLKNNQRGNNVETLFWPGDEISVRGPAK